LYGFARRLGLADEAAEDAAQEALLRLFRALLDGESIVDERAWVFRTLYRLAIDQHRLRKRIAGLRDRLAGSPTVESPHDVDSRLTIWAFVDRLPERQRQTLYLRYRADMSFEAIAAVMGISPGGARGLAAKGLERLRRMVPADEATR
jgi:RNA polymerase sigma-70 factor (ECF subfamily)